MVERRATGHTNFFSSSSVGTLPALVKLWFLLSIAVDVQVDDASSLGTLGCASGGPDSWVAATVRRSTRCHWTWRSETERLLHPGQKTQSPWRCSPQEWCHRVMVSDGALSGPPRQSLRYTALSQERAVAQRDSRATRLRRRSGTALPQKKSTSRKRGALGKFLPRRCRFGEAPIPLQTRVDNRRRAADFQSRPVIKSRSTQPPWDNHIGFGALARNPEHRRAKYMYLPWKGPKN